MTFDGFIQKLNKEDKDNFNQYSPIRGVQVYKIIFKALYNITNNTDFSYGEVNSFVRYDKAIKDELFTYLGTLEDIIRKYIFDNFDLKSGIQYKKKYICFKDIKDKIIRFENKGHDVTELYSRWSLMFGGIIDFLEYYDISKFDLGKLKQVKELRNDVMHHATLLFTCSGNSKANETIQRIKALIELLPSQYIGLKTNINNITSKVKNNVREKFYELLLGEL